MGSDPKQTHSVHCNACNAKFNMSEKLWNKRVLGRVTTIHCRKCSAPIKLDGRHDEMDTDASGSERPVESEPAVQPTPSSGMTESPLPLSSRVPPVLAPPRARALSSAPKPKLAPSRFSASEATEQLPKKAQHAPRGMPAPSIRLKGALKAPDLVATSNPPRPPLISAALPKMASKASQALEVRPLPMTPVEAALPPKVDPVMAAPSTESSPSAVDAESVPSLRALVVASPSSDAPAPRAPDAPSEPESMVQKLPSERAEPGSARPSPRRVLPWKLGALVAVAAGAVLYFQSSAGSTRVDAHSSSAASQALPTPWQAPEPLNPEAFDPSASVTPAPPETVEPTDATELPANHEPSPAARPTANDPAQQVATAYDAQQLGFALRWARKQALDCHRGGRAGGTVNVEVEFAPEGRVSNVVLRGEPIASAPVGGCVESYFKAMLIPSFSGPAFTVKEQLTLR